MLTGRFPLLLDAALRPSMLQHFEVPQDRLLCVH